MGLAVGVASDLYLADHGNNRVQRRDVEGNWSVIASTGTDPGQTNFPSGIAMDSAGNLYIVDSSDGENNRIQKRDIQGNWSLIAASGAELGQVVNARALAFDRANNLYVADWGAEYGRIQKRDVEGNWTLIASSGCGLGKIAGPSGLAVDAASTVYVAGHLYDCSGFYQGRIERRNAEGNWSVIAPSGPDLGEVFMPSALAVDTAGNLYVADRTHDGDTGVFQNRIQKRDVQGNWMVIPFFGSGTSRVTSLSGLAVDVAGNLYVADTRNDRVLKYAPDGGQ
jgi:DNA-binding beta-propeller fold protein YncE